MSFEMAMVNNPLLKIVWIIQTNIFTYSATVQQESI